MRVAIACLCAVLGAGCGRTHAPKNSHAPHDRGTTRDASHPDARDAGEPDATLRTDASTKEDAGARIDASFDAGPSLDAGDAPDARPGEDAARDADVPDAYALVRCPADAAPERWDQPEWVADPELSTLTPSSIDDAGCQIALDQLDDQVLDERWGYDYDADGRLTRVLYWRDTGPRDFVALAYRADGRIARACDQYSGCRAVTYDDATHSARAVFYDSKKQLRLDGMIHAAFDDRGKLKSFHSCDQLEQIYRPALFDLELENGVARTWVRSNDEFEGRREFDAEGNLTLLDEQHDPETFAAHCNAEGWETDYDECLDSCGFMLNQPYGPGFTYHIDYTRDLDGRVMSSKTSISFPKATSFSTTYHYSPDGRAVELASSEDMGAWSETSMLYFDPPPEQREYDSDGNLSAVHIDTDRDGSFKRLDRYRYSGTGACRHGQNPQLAPAAPEMPLAAEIGLSYHPYPDRCRYTPVTATIHDRYNPR